MLQIRTTFAAAIGAAAMSALVGCESALPPPTAGADTNSSDAGNVSSQDAATDADAAAVNDTGTSGGGDGADVAGDSASTSDSGGGTTDATAVLDATKPPPDSTTVSTCANNAACSAGSYCAFPEGKCNTAGTCTVKPQVCTKELKEVCGCDGNTYGNPCNAAAAGTSVATTGKCGGTIPAGDCTVGGPPTCGFSEYCKAPTANTCSGPGKCTAKPQACTMEYGPVCGCDGKEYGNPCEAAAGGSNVKAGGPCGKPDPTGCDVATQSGCTKTEYCKSTGVGVCDGKGTCVVKPEACTMQYAPVCGCDGKTHGNACGAAGAGTNVAKQGECGGGGTGTLKWYKTCGAPVCGGWMPKKDVPLCTTEAEGDPCKTPGGQCDPKDGCNALLLCTEKDPKAGGVGCPISKAKYKRDIRYVEATEARELAARLLAMKLATYKYTAQGPQAPTRLGFIIDDDPHSPAVDAERDMVDLYGYLSMAVATLQQQGKELESLRREVASLKAAAPMCAR